MIKILLHIVLLLSKVRNCIYDNDLVIVMDDAQKLHARNLVLKEKESKKWRDRFFYIVIPLTSTAILAFLYKEDYLSPI